MARELATNVATQAKVAQVVSMNGSILEVVGIDFQTSKSQLTNWVDSNQIVITSLRDPDGTYPQSQKVFTTREWWLIVDLRTMQIVAKYFGSHAGGSPSVTALNAALDDTIARLK